MAFINYQYLYSRGLSDSDYHLLQKIFQKEVSLLETQKDSFKGLFELDLITYLKGKENTTEGVRISKKGKKFLSDLETKSYNDQIGLLLEELISMFESNGKFIGNKLEVQSRLIWFIGQTGFSTKIILKSVDSYLVDNPEYTLSLENLLWKPQSVAFSVHKSLKNSKLFDIITKKYKLDMSFFLKPKGKVNTWLFTVSGLQVPLKGKPHLYFTGSAKGDKEHILKIKEELLYEVGETNKLFTD